MSIAIFTFGRFNPPTIGHMLLVDRVKTVAKQKGGKPFVFTGQSTDAKKNPLPYKTKTSYMKKSFKDVTVVASPSIKTVFDALGYLDKKKYKEVILVVGSDRVSEFKKLITKYLGDYNITSFKVVSAGERDPDASGVKGMSASKMRAAAVRGDYDAFRLGCPKTLKKSDCRQLFRDVQKGMGVREHLEESWFNYNEFEEFVAERKISISTRRKMGRVAKRTAKRRAKTRLRKQKFKKSTETLKLVARKQAKSLLRKKIIGDVNWSSLSVSQRASIDDRLAKKSGAVDKIAKKLLPRVKVAERERLQKLRGSTPGQADESNKIFKKKEEVMNEHSEEKPLLRWMEVFRSELKRGGSSYKKVDPIDALKLYYRGVDPKKAVSQLKESVELNESWTADSVKRNADIGSKNGYGINIKKTGSITKTPYKHMLMTNSTGKKIKVKFDHGKDRFVGTADEVASHLNKILGIKESVSRDYKKEYENYHSKPKQRANRSKRVLARRELEKQGRVSKGDGNDVDHKDGNPQNNSKGNLRVLTTGKNRGRDNNKWRNEEQDTFKGQAIEKAVTDARVKKAEINAKIADARGDLEKSIASGKAGDDLKSLRDKLTAAREKGEALRKSMEASNARMKALRAKLKKTNEEHGAGDEGTPKALKKYKDFTPGENGNSPIEPTPKVKKKKINAMKTGTEGY